MLDGRFTHGTPQEMAAKRRQALPARLRERLTLSPKEAGALLGRSEDFCRDLCRHRQVLFKNYNGRLMIDVDSFLEFLDTGEVAEIFWDGE